MEGEIKQEEEQGTTTGEEEFQMGEMLNAMETPPEEEKAEEGAAAPTTEAPAIEEVTAPLTPPKRKVGVKRAALKIVRENVDQIRKDLSYNLSQIERGLYKET